MLGRQLEPSGLPHGRTQWLMCRAVGSTHASLCYVLCCVGVCQEQLACRAATCKECKPTAITLQVARSEEAVSSAAKNSEDPKQEIAVVQANQAAAAANQAAAQAQAVADAQDTAAAVALQNAAQQAVAKKNARHLSQRHHRGEE